MGDSKKYKLLTLSVSAFVLNNAGSAFADDATPIPSLKPAMQEDGEYSLAIDREIPQPSLKPSAKTLQKSHSFAELSPPTPKLKPVFYKKDMSPTQVLASVPIPTRKPINGKRRKHLLYAQVPMPAPSLKPQVLTSSLGKTYGSSFFSQYAPVTAADMVDKLPNFTLSEIDSKRGLGQGGVNVLINGVRLSGKDNDARSALNRIPAASVEKIEILSGASLNIPGLSSTVANIITNQNELSGSWKYRAEVQERSRANLFGFEGSVSGSRGPIEYVIGIESNPRRDTEIGPESISNELGQIIEMRDERALAFNDNPKVSAEFTYSPDNGHVAHLNANYQTTNMRIEETSLQSALTSNGVNGQRLTGLADDGWNGELGGDYAFDLGAGNLKLIGITRHADSDFTSRFRAFDFNGNDNTSVFTQASKSGETIARGEYSFKQDETLDWQFAVEAALNYLEIDATLAESDASGTLVSIPFPGSSSRVEEQRAESHLTANWKVSDKFSLQASAGVEFSELSQTGPSGLTREFVRPKGLLSTSYVVSDDFNIRTKVERKVGQLDFDTFISSVSLADDLANAGNPEIVPAQSWDGEIEFEKSWDNGISGTFKLYGQKIEDVVDRIPLPNGGDAPGNIDNADVVGVELVGTVLMDSFGLEGARIDLELAAENSSVTDALTGLERRLSESLVSTYTVDFRHDIPNTKWAWGGNVIGYRESANFRLNQTTHFTEGVPDVQAFIEHKNIMGLTVRVDVKNALSAEYKNSRTLFGGVNRAMGSIIGTESRVRTAAPRYGISISGTF